MFDPNKPLRDALLRAFGPSVAAYHKALLEEEETRKILRGEALPRLSAEDELFLAQCRIRGVK